MFARLFATNKNPYIPGWNNRRRLDFDLSGVKFSIEVPYSNAPDAGAHCADSRINIFDPNNYPADVSDLAEFSRSPFRYLSLFNENWDVFGSMGSSCRGGLTLSVNVVQVTDLPSGFTCGKEQDFMQVANREMYFRYGPPNIDDYMPKVPMNWSAKNLNNSDWLYYEAWPDVIRYSDVLAEWMKNRFSFVYLKPILDTYFLCVFSRFGGVGCDPSSDISNFIRREIDKILESASVIGPVSQISLQEVMETRGPVCWDEHVTKNVQQGSGEFEEVIDVYGTPAPIYK